jgi:hypothetical protein
MAQFLASSGLDSGLYARLYFSPKSIGKTVTTRSLIYKFQPLDSVLLCSKIKSSILSNLELLSLLLIPLFGCFSEEIAADPPGSNPLCLKENLPVTSSILLPKVCSFAVSTNLTYFVNESKFSMHRQQVRGKFLHNLLLAIRGKSPLRDPLLAVPAVVEHQTQNQGSFLKLKTLS